MGKFYCKHGVMLDTASQIQPREEDFDMARPVVAKLRIINNDLALLYYAIDGETHDDALWIITNRHNYLPWSDYTQTPEMAYQQFRERKEGKTDEV